MSLCDKPKCAQRECAPATLCGAIPAGEGRGVPVGSITPTSINSSGHSYLSVRVPQSLCLTCNEGIAETIVSLSVSPEAVVTPLLPAFTQANPTSADLPPSCLAPTVATAAAAAAAPTPAAAVTAGDDGLMEGRRRHLEMEEERVGGRLAMAVAGVEEA